MTLAVVTAPVLPALDTEGAARLVDVSRSYGRSVALAGVSVSIPTGRLTAIQGPAGAGKSTLLRCLSGLEAVSSGAVWVGGTLLSELGGADRTRFRRDSVGVVLPRSNLLATLTAAENITLPQLLAGRSADPDWLARVVATTGVAGLLDRRPSQLTGGEQQRVAVARAVLSRPDVVVADEPTAGLDTRSSAAVVELLRRAVDELGQSVVLATRDPATAGHADRVLFLAGGRLVP